MCHPFPHSYIRCIFAARLLTRFFTFKFLQQLRKCISFVTFVNFSCPFELIGSPSIIVGSPSSWSDHGIEKGHHAFHQTNAHNLYRHGTTLHQHHFQHSSPTRPHPLTFYRSQIFCRLSFLSIQLLYHPSLTETVLSRLIAWWRHLYRGSRWQLQPFSSIPLHFHPSHAEKNEYRKNFPSTVIDPRDVDEATKVIQWHGDRKVKIGKDENSVRKFL